LSLLFAFSAFAEARLLVEHHGITLSSPRLSKGRSVYQPTIGVEGDCAETYYRINVFYPAVDAIKLDVELRFGWATTTRLLSESPSATTLHQWSVRTTVHTGHYPLFISLLSNISNFLVPCSVLYYSIYDRCTRL